MDITKMAPIRKKDRFFEVAFNKRIYEFAE